MNARTIATVAMMLAVPSPRLAVARERGPIEVSLRYQVTNRDDGPPISLTGLSRAALRIAPAIDDRGKGQAIGANVEDERTTDVVARGSVPDFVSSVVREELGGLGIRTDDTAGQVLEIHLVELWVEEGSVYKGQARLRAVLSSRDGRELWAGLTQGTSTRWGRSRSQDNYNEVISDSLWEAMTQLLRDDGFRAALTR